MKEDKRDKLLNRLKKQCEDKPKSRQRAILYMCASCLYDSEVQGSGSYLLQIKNCTSYTCPLYNLRPQPVSGHNEEDVES